MAVFTFNDQFGCVQEFLLETGQGYGDDIKYCPAAGRQENQPINVNYKTIVAYEPECVLHMCLPAQRIHMFYHFMTF